ncbi:MAG: lamin tail domain-containing protein [bacterium]|nr:lamin tail domain-containing protein [bacterium]
MRTMILWFAVLMLTVTAFAQSAIINEWSQGNGGNKEWMEYLVIQNNLDIRGWQVWDETQLYTTFNASNEMWSAVPAGTIIVVYNGNDRDVTLPAKDSLLTDGNYLICVNHNDANLFTAGTWGGYGNTNLSDNPRLILSDGTTIVHDWDNGNNTSFSVNTLRPAGNQAVKYASNTAVGVLTATNWARIAATAGNVTPGEGNGGDNSTWIASLRGQTAPPVIESVSRVAQNPTPNTAIAIDATISGTTSPTVNIRYKLNETGDYQSVAMSSAGGNWWTGSIPGQPEGMLVSYYVEASNQGSSVVRSPSSDSRFRVYSTVLGTGTVVVNEIMYNINTTNSQEWIEFYNNTASAIDLSYFMLMDNNARSYTLPLGTTIGAGEYRVAPYATAQFLLDYPGFNAALLLPPFNFEFSIPSDQVRLFDVNGNLVDVVNYTTSSPWPSASAGYSIELSDASLDNDVGANWHLAGDLGGTPGAANSGGVDIIPPSFTAVTWISPTVLLLNFSEPVRHDTMLIAEHYAINSVALTSTSFDSAVLSADNKQVKLYLDNTAALLVGQSYTISVLNFYDAAGNVTTSQDQTLLYLRPALQVTEIMYNPSHNDTYYEWFEILNTTTDSINMRDYILADNNARDTIDIDLWVRPQRYVVFGVHRDSLLSIGIPCAWQYTSGLALSNSGDRVVVYTPSGVLIDSVRYGVLPPWPVNPTPLDTGRSIALYNPMANNDFSDYWFSSIILMANGEYGTPGQVFLVEPVIVTNPLSGDFGNVNPGTTDTLQVVVRNTGNGDLVITNLTTPANIVPSWTSATIEALDSMILELYWTPPTAGTLQDTVRFTSNAVNIEYVLPVTGVAQVPAPPPAPENLTAIRINSDVFLQWTASEGAVLYRIYAAEVANGQWTEIGTSMNTTFTDTNVLGSFTHRYYRVTANN